MTEGAGLLDTRRLVKRAAGTDFETKLIDLNADRSAGMARTATISGKLAAALAMFVLRPNGERTSFECEAIRNFSGLTFEVSWSQRRGALDSKRKMGRRPCA